MKSIGSLLLVVGLAALIFGFMDRAPKLLAWIYDWGEGPAWAIKLGLVAVGGLLVYLGGRKQSQPAGFINDESLPS